MNELTDWINAQLADRGWSGNELARRAEVSSGGFSLVMTGQRNPGLDFCLGIARALDEPPERVLRLAGLLPPIPPSVHEEREAIVILRGLNSGMRKTALAMLRALGRMDPTASIREPLVPYETTGRPRTAGEWLRRQVDVIMRGLPLDDQQQVLDVAQGLIGENTDGEDGTDKREGRDE